MVQKYVIFIIFFTIILTQLLIKRVPNPVGRKPVNVQSGHYQLIQLHVYEKHECRKERKLIRRINVLYDCIKINHQMLLEKYVNPMLIRYYQKRKLYIKLWYYENPYTQFVQVMLIVHKISPSLMQIFPRNIFVVTW